MNAVLELGSPPEDPRGQLEWLGRALRALDTSKDRKIRPLKKQLARLMFQFQRGVDRGECLDTVRARIGPQVDALLAATFRTLSKTLRNLAGTMRVKHAQGKLDASPGEISRLLSDIEVGARQFEDFASAVQTGNTQQMTAARSRLTETAERLKEPVAALS